MATRKSRILGPNGEPIETSILTEEVGEATLTGIRSVWDRTPIAGNLSPSLLANLLIEADQNAPRNYLTLAEEMEEREPHYASVLSTRKNAVAGLDIGVEEGSDDAQGKKHADAVKEIVRAPEFVDMLMDLLDALGKGYSAVDIIWHRGAEWRPERYEWRDPRFFIFDYETMRELRLLTDDQIMGVPLPAYKFLIHMPKRKTGLPIRGGLARLAAASYLCKAYTLTDWMAFAEVFGMPLRVGRYGAGATQEEINTLITAVANIGSDAAAILPEGMKIEFEKGNSEGGRGGGEKLFEGLADWLDRQTSKAVLGQTLTTDALSTGLGSNVASVHDEVRDDILRHDKRQLENTLNRDLIKPYIDLNYGPQKVYPRVQLQIFDSVDVKALSAAVATLVPFGLRVSQDELRDKIGLRDPAKDEEVLRPAASGAAPAPGLDNAPNAQQIHQVQPNPTNAPDADDIDDMAASGASDWEPMMSPLVEKIETLAAQVAANGGGREEFIAGLGELFQDMDEAEMAQAFAAANFKARALGDANDDPAV